MIEQTEFVESRTAVKSMSRRDFLRLSGTGLAGVALLGFAKPASAATGTSAHKLGIKSGNSAATNRKNLIKALSNSSRSITFPPGDYLIDNSGSYIIINNFSGRLEMHSKARFVFTDNTTRGLIFARGTGARVIGLKTSFKTLPPKRVNAQECILFQKTTDTVVKRARIYGSAAAGLLFWRCTRPSVYGTVIRNTRADGLHFANCQDARANNIRTINTGDDGVAFLNYANGPDKTGGLATNIKVRKSKARGITVVGQSDVLIRNFSVYATAGPGIYCAYEKSYNTRVPSKVRFIDGTVRKAGTLSGSGNKSGIEYNKPKSVVFKDVDVISPAGRGVSGIAPSGFVGLFGVRALRVPSSGFDLRAKRLSLAGLVARNTDGTGIAVLDSGYVRYGRLRSVNTSKKNSLHRAFSFENNRRLNGKKLIAVDKKTRPTGYVLGAYGNQSGQLGRAYDRIKARKLKVENRSDLKLAV